MDYVDSGNGYNMQTSFTVRSRAPDQTQYLERRK